MLLEFAFGLGGAACIAGGVLLAMVGVALQVVADAPMFLLSSLMLVAFGGFLLYVARGARRERLEMLRSAEQGHPPSR